MDDVILIEDDNSNVTVENKENEDETQIPAGFRTPGKSAGENKACLPSTSTDPDLIDEEDCPATQILDSRVLKNVVAYVEVRSGHENRSRCVELVLEKLGAEISKTLTKKVTHVIFCDGTRKTLLKAKERNLPILSVGWVAACRENQQHVAENLYRAERIDSPTYVAKLRKLKSMTPEDSQKVYERITKRLKKKWKKQEEIDARFAWIYESPPPNFEIPKLNKEAVWGYFLPRDYMSSDEDEDKDKDGKDEEMSPSTKDCNTPFIMRIMKNYPDSPGMAEIREVAKIRSARNKAARRQSRVAGERASSTGGSELNLSNTSANSDEVFAGQPGPSDAAQSSQTPHRDSNETNMDVISMEMASMDMNATPERFSAVSDRRRSLRIFKQKTAIEAPLPPPAIPKVKRKSMGKRKLFSQEAQSLVCVTPSSLTRTPATTEGPSVPQKRKRRKSRTPKKTRTVSCHRALRPDSEKTSEEVPVKSRRSLDDFKLTDNSKRRNKVLMAKVITHTPDTPAATQQASSKLPETPVCRKLVLTSLSQSDKEAVFSIVKTLGQFSIVDRVDDFTTHVICGDNRRTFNVLDGFTHGCWILSMKWIYASMEANAWVDEEPYQLAGDYPAANHSLLNDTRQILFADVGPMFVSEKTLPPPDRLKHLIIKSGGQVSQNRREVKFCVGECYRSETIVCVSAKWILDCIAAQTLLSTDLYKLSSPAK